MERVAKREEQLEQLERQSESDLPEIISGMSDEQFEAVFDLVESVLERERKGFDRFFESISQTLRYIPNFLVLAITNKYIDPPIAARITSKLPIKSAVQIAKGLSVEYVCETAVFMNERYSVELLARLPKKQAQDVIACLAEQHPLRVLDILEYADKSLLKSMVKHGLTLAVLEKDLNELRLVTFKKLHALA